MLCFCDKKGGWKGAVIYLLYNGIVWGLFGDCLGIARGLFGKNKKCLKFYLKGLRKAEKYVILIVYGN